MRFGLGVLVSGLMVGAAAYATNPGVGAGEAGYVTWKPLTFWNNSKFMDVIIGPTNYGWGLRNYVVQRINIQPQTFDEFFDVVDANQIKMHFEVHYTMRPSPQKAAIKLLVEQYGGADWYASVVKQPMRTFAREAIGNLDSQLAAAQQEKIQENIDKMARDWLAKHHIPILLEQVSVGNFQFPTAISEAAAEKQANLQRLQAKSTLLEIAKKDAEIKAAEAEGVRMAQDIINQTLTPIYVQHEMVRAIEAIANKPGNAIYFVPINPSTGLPLMNQVQEAPARQQGRP